MRVETVNFEGMSARITVEGDGPPLVYLHGAGGANWSPGLDILAKHFRVYMPEHPGFGESERPEWIETAQDVALFYMDLFEAMKLSQINLVGQSLGGWIAAELASLCAHQLRRLVLVDAAGLQVRGVEQPDMFTLSPAALVRILYYDQARAEAVLSQTPTPEMVRASVRNRAMTARLAWNPYLSNPRLRDRLRRIRVPTLVLWGAQDRLIPPEHGRAYAEAIPGARLLLIERCGHLAASEQAEEFARLVGDFVTEERA